MTVALLVGLLVPQDSEEVRLLLDVEPFEVEGRGLFGESVRQEQEADRPGVETVAVNENATMRYVWGYTRSDLRVMIRKAKRLGYRPIGCATWCYVPEAGCYAWRQRIR